MTSQLRGDVTNGVLFLANRPSFAGHNTSTPTISGANAFTAITLDTDDADPWLGHSPLGSAPQNWYCQAPGWYLCEGAVPWSASGASYSTFSCGIGVNTSGGLTSYQGGAQVITSASARPVVYAADLVQLTRTGSPGAASADYVQLQAWNDTGGFRLLGSGPDFPRLQLRWMGTGAASSLAVPSSAAWPVPPAFIGQSWLNANIRDTLKFLANPPMIRVAQASTLIGNIPSTTWPSGTLIAAGRYVGTTLDNYSAFSGSTYTVPAGCGGVWYAHGQAGLSAAGVPAAYATGISINGTITWGGACYAAANGTGGPVITGLCGRFRLSPGDTVQLAAFQNSGSPVTSQSGVTKLILAWESS